MLFNVKVIFWDIIIQKVLTKDVLKYTHFLEKCIQINYNSLDMYYCLLFMKINI